MGQDVLPCSCSLQSLFLESNLAVPVPGFSEGKRRWGLEEEQADWQSEEASPWKCLPSGFPFAARVANEIGGDRKAAFVKFRTLAEALVSSKW